MSSDDIGAGSPPKILLADEEQRLSVTGAWRILLSGTVDLSPTGGESAGKAEQGCQLFFGLHSSEQERVSKINRARQSLMRNSVDTANINDYLQLIEESASSWLPV